MTIEDTLKRARARLPERHFAGGYGLKDLARDYLQVDHPVEFTQVTTHPKRKVTVKYRKSRTCSCGAAGCKKKTPKKPRKATKKNPTPDNTPHEKTEVVTAVIEWSVLKKRVKIPITDITWERAGLPHCCGGVPWPEFTETTGLVCWPCLWEAFMEYAGNDALWALRLPTEVLSKEGHAYGHDKPTPEDLPRRPSR